MPATASVVAQVNSDFSTPAQTRTTGSFTPTANSKLVVVVGSLDATHATAKSWTISGGGLSWSSHANSADHETPAFSATDTTWGMTVWWADVGGSPGSMTVTADPHATTDEGFIGITVFEVIGASVGVLGNVQASASAFATNPTAVTVSLGSGKSANSVLLAGWFLLSDGGTSSYDAAVPAGWTRTLPSEVAGVSVAGLISTTDSDASLQYGSAANTSYSSGFIVEVGEASAVATLDQEGFRFGEDDGNEASHTWAAAQDTDLAAALGAQLLRVLIDTEDDAASAAYTLRAQQNGAGGYVAVPVGASSKPQPLIETGDITTSGSNTAQSSWAVSVPAAATGDLIIMCLGWDDSTTTTDATPASGPNGETWTRVGGAVVASASTEVRATVYRTIATGSWSSGTITTTPTATESWIARVIKVVAGEFDASTPIGTSGTVASAATNETGVDAPALTAGSSDGSGTLVNWSIADADPQTVNGSGWTGRSTQDIGDLSCALATRDAAVTDSESISQFEVATITSDSWCSVGFIVRAPTVTNELYISTSANITGGGEATTARLTAPSGKTTGDFTTGRRWDDENGSDSIDIAADFYTEVEWSLTTQVPATDGDYWDFRVYAGSTPLDTYTEEPRWTIASGDTEADAGNAAGTGEAFNATTAVAASTAVATGTGEAFDATTTAESTASAEVAEGSGAALDADTAIAPRAAVAEGTGAAFDATVDVAADTDVNAENATGTGEALDASASIAPRAEAAAGTGAALDVTARVAASTATATGAGEALDAAGRVAPNAAVAEGSGAAFDATVSTQSAVQVDAENAPGSGEAYDVTATIVTSAAVAEGSGEAFDATVSTESATNASAGHAAGSGEASQPSSIVAPRAAVAEATGAAHDATVSTSSAATASAGAATGTGEALTPSVSIGQSAGHAEGTGAALDASASLAVNAEPATGSGEALAASPAIAPRATTSEGSGSAGEPSGAVGVRPALIEATGEAFDATASTTSAGQGSAGLAEGSGQAFDPTLSISSNVPAENATGSGAATDATIDIASSAVAASGSGTAFAATISITTNAGHAEGTGAAFGVSLQGVTIAQAEHITASGQAFDALVEIRAGERVGTSAGWYSLLGIIHEAARELADERSRPPTACPNDGTPLLTGSDGQLYCPHDGWTEGHGGGATSHRAITTYEPLAEEHWSWG